MFDLRMGIHYLNAIKFLHEVTGSKAIFFFPWCKDKIMI